MHVEITQSARLELWDLLDLAEGKQHEELEHCIPSKAFRNEERREIMSRSDGVDAVLTISNIRNGQNLANSKYPFLWKLYEMLDDCEKTGDDHIVSWMDEGRGFRVHKPKSFMQKIVPHYFKQSKFKSFQRQLHLYDFVRTQRGMLTGTYAHPRFIRGKKSLCLSLSPHKIKGNGKDSNVLGSVSSGPLQVFSQNIPSLARKRIRDEDADEPAAKRAQSAPTPVNGQERATTAFPWGNLRSVFVTGASLAADLEAKKQTVVEESQMSTAPPTTTTTGTPMALSCPHSDDVVYSFEAKPFRFLDDVCNDDNLLDAILMDSLEKDELMDFLHENLLMNAAM